MGLKISKLGMEEWSALVHEHLDAESASSRGHQFIYLKGDQEIPFPA